MVFPNITQIIGNKMKQNFTLPMNLRINFEKPFMYWLTLQKYYTKFCRINFFESMFYCF